MKLITKIFIGIDILILICVFIVYGPIDKARVFWISTAMETMNHKYLAYIFYSKDTINKVINENYYVELEEATDESQITINKIEEKATYESEYEKQVMERDDDENYKLIKFKYNEFNCYLVAIYDPTKINVGIANDKINGSGQILTEIAKNNDAVVAINGGGYLWSNGRPRGLVVKDGKVLYSQSSIKYTTAAITNDGVLIAGNLSSSDISKKKIKYALSFGPALIVNGKPMKIIGTGGSGLNPRTVIAQRKDGIILFLVVNGYDQSISWKGRGGVYLNDLLIILQRYGAYNAVNMDGGSSTTMVINNELINSPVEPLKKGQDFIRTAWILKK